MQLSKKERINALLDWYGVLLTEKQAELSHLYYREDFSLSEIATHIQSSRSAIHDALKRVEYILETYETQLHLYERFLQRQVVYEKLKKLDYAEVNDLVHQLETME